MAWTIQFEGAKAAVRAAVDAYALGGVPAPQPPLMSSLPPGTTVQLDAPLQDPDPAEVAWIDFIKTTIMRLIDGLPQSQNAVVVYASGDGSAILVLRVEGRAYTL